MRMIDFVLYETFSGGSKFFYHKYNDIQITRSLFTYVYTLILGGNVEASTTGNEQARNLRYDYWGNAAFYQNSPEKWLNSSFEKAINQVEISSVGRVKLEDALNADLKRLQTFGEVTGTVQIVDADFIRTNIVLEGVGKFTLTWKANIDEDILPLPDEGGATPTPPQSSYDFSPSGDYNFSGDNSPYDFSQ